MSRLATSQAGEKESEERHAAGGDLDVEGQEDDEEGNAKATTTMTVGGNAVSEMGGARGGDRAAPAMGGSDGFPGGKFLWVGVETPHRVHKQQLVYL